MPSQNTIVNYFCNSFRIISHSESHLPNILNSCYRSKKFKLLHHCLDNRQLPLSAIISWFLLTKTSEREIEKLADYISQIWVTISQSKCYHRSICYSWVGEWKYWGVESVWKFSHRHNNLSSRHMPFYCGAKRLLLRQMGRGFGSHFSRLLRQPQ